jgi:hypothetical protein
LGLLGSRDRHVPRSNIIEELSQRWPQQTTWQWLVDRAIHDTDSSVTNEAIGELARRWKDDTTREWLIDRVTSDVRTDIRNVAAKQLTANWGFEHVGKLMIELASQNENPAARNAALIGLAQLRDGGVRRFILSRVRQVEDPQVRQELIWAFVWVWGDERAMEFLLTCALEDKHAEVRQTAIHQLARHWRSESTQRLLLGRPSEAGKGARIQFMHELVRQWKDDRTRKVLAEIAAQDENAEVRHAALAKLIAVWPDAPTEQILPFLRAQSG